MRKNRREGGRFPDVRIIMARAKRDWATTVNIFLRSKEVAAATWRLWGKIGE